MNAKNYIQDIVSNEEHREGPVAKAIENQTAKVPSDLFLWLAGGAIAASATLQILGRRETSNFVGQWAPTLLILGLYNKIVKAVGSDREDADSQESSKPETSFPKKKQQQPMQTAQSRPLSTKSTSQTSQSTTTPNTSGGNGSSYGSKQSQSSDPEGLQQSAAL